MGWHRGWKCDIDCICDSITFQWVNEKKKVVWWETPRVGSSSLKKTLNPAPDPAWRRITESEIVEFPYDNYFNFTTIVNPWRRVASCYYLYTHYRERQAESIQLFGNLPTFREFVSRMFNEGSRNHHWCPIVNYVPSENAQFDCQYILLEELTEQWDILAINYNFPQMKRETEPSSVNQWPWREYYINYPNIFSMVAGYYQEDLRRFGQHFSAAVIEDFPPEVTL